MSADLNSAKVRHCSALERAKIRGQTKRSWVHRTEIIGLRLVCPHLSYFTFPCMKELPSSSLWRVSLRHMQALRKGLHRSEWHQPSCRQKRMG